MSRFFCRVVFLTLPKFIHSAYVSLHVLHTQIMSGSFPSVLLPSGLSLRVEDRVVSLCFDFAQHPESTEGSNCTTRLAMPGHFQSSILQ